MPRASKHLRPVQAAGREEGGTAAPGFDWIDLVPRKAQIRLFIALLTIIGFLTQATAEVTGEDVPPGYAPLTTAAACVAAKLNESIGPIDGDDDEAEAE